MPKTFKHLKLEKGCSLRDEIISIVKIKLGFFAAQGEMGIRLGIRLDIHGARQA